MSRNIKVFMMSAVVLALAGCASVQNPDPNDPWESYNRSMYKFNEVVDGYVVKPVAEGYNWVMPEVAKDCVHGVFGNFGDAWSTVNSALQARGRDTAHSLGRVLINTTAGVGGCFDVASKTGVEKRPNDFGTTLGVWGIGSGPYLQLPLFGPSTVRDAVGLIGDSAGRGAAYLSPLSISEDAVAYSVLGLQLVDARTQLLDADNLANDISLDKYSFVRDAYLQNRNQQVNNYSGEVIPDPNYKKPQQLPATWENAGDVSARFPTNGYVPYISVPANGSNGGAPTYVDPEANN